MFMVYVQYAHFLVISSIDQLNWVNRNSIKRDPPNMNPTKNKSV